jgi:condensin complex subunit 1
MQNLTYFEHLAEPMAEMLNILEKEFDHTSLTEEILRYVIPFDSFRKRAPLKHFCGLLVLQRDLVEEVFRRRHQGPKSFLTLFGPSIRIIHAHDNEADQSSSATFGERGKSSAELRQSVKAHTFIGHQAHPMRMALVEIVGHLIRDLTLSDEGDADQQKKRIKSFFEILFERLLDLNSWVRAKVLQTLIKLCE